MSLEARTTTFRSIIGRPARRLTLLFVCLALVTAARFGHWWQSEHRHRWLAQASINELSAAASRDESDVAVFEQLGKRAHELEQWPRAARAFQHACELAPDRVGNWIGWARATYEFASFHAADAILSNYLQRHPRDGKAYLERAALRRDAKRIEMAWGDADAATRWSPDDGKAWALRGDLCLDQGIAGEGEASFRRARALMPRSAWPHVGLYQAYVAQGKKPEALATARLIVERFPKVAEGKLYLGEALVEAAKSAEDHTAARRVLKEASTSEDVLRREDRFALHFLLGRTFFNQGRWGEALPHLRRARALIDDNPDMLFLLGRTYRALGDSARAEATMRKHRQVYEDTATVRQFMARINDNPNDAKARLEFARWYARKDIPGGAAIQYEEMMARGLDVETARRELQALEVRGAARP